MLVRVARDTCEVVRSLQARTYKKTKSTRKHKHTESSPGHSSVKIAFMMSATVQSPRANASGKKEDAVRAPSSIQNSDKWANRHTPSVRTRPQPHHNLEDFMCAKRGSAIPNDPVYRDHVNNEEH